MAGQVVGKLYMTAAAVVVIAGVRGAGARTETARVVV
jgi:hypothetical protein